MTYLKVFTDFRELMEPLNAEEKGRLFEAMLSYAMDGAEIALPEILLREAPKQGALLIKILNKCQQDPKFLHMITHLSMCNRKSAHNFYSDILACTAGKYNVSA